MAELEKELGLALEEQKVESSSAGTQTSPCLRSAEAPNSLGPCRPHHDTPSLIAFVKYVSRWHGCQLMRPQSKSVKHLEAAV
jgi:hypothetical protein